MKQVRKIYRLPLIGCRSEKNAARAIAAVEALLRERGE